MEKHELEARTKTFSLNVINFLSTLPKSKVMDVVGHQLLKSATSIGANYREANRAESRKDFIHKIGICEKEAAETQYWLEIIKDTYESGSSYIDSLLQESGELLAIFTSIGRSSKRK